MISLAMQLARLQLQCMGERDRLEKVSGNSRWPQHDIAQKRQALAELEAATETFRWLVENERTVKQRVAA